jgi:hypothetical protein
MQMNKTNLNQSVKFLICEIIENYYRWSDSIKMKSGNDSDARDKQAKEFKNGITYKINNKYIKIYTTTKWGQHSVWGFIVRDNDTVKCTHKLNGGNYFSEGDLLRALSWNQANTQQAVGNIRLGTMDNRPRQNPIYPDYKAIWTGASK